MRCYKEKLTEFTQCETSHWVPFLCIVFLRGMVCVNVCHWKLVMSSPQTCTEFSHGNAASLSYRQPWAQVKSYRYSLWQENYPSSSPDQCDTWALGQKEMLRVLLQMLFWVTASTFLPKQPLTHTHKAQTQKCPHLSHQFLYLFCDIFKIGK